MSDLANAAALADAWAREHGCRDILHCCQTPLAAFSAGMAAERERIARLATSEAARMRASNFAEHEAISAATLEDFADLIREGGDG